MYCTCFLRGLSILNGQSYKSSYPPNVPPSVMGPRHRTRIKTEGTAKVVTVGWGMYRMLHNPFGSKDDFNKSFCKNI